MPFCDPLAKSYQPFAIDVLDPSVGQLVTFVVSDFVLDVASPLFDVFEGGMAFDFFLGSDCWSLC